MRILGMNWRDRAAFRRSAAMLRSVLLLSAISMLTLSSADARGDGHDGGHETSNQTVPEPYFELFERPRHGLGVPPTPNPPVCAALVENLNIMAEAHDLACDLPIAPDIEGLGEFEWQDAGLEDRQTIIKSHWMRSNSFHLQRAWEKDGGYLEALARLYPDMPTPDAFRSAGMQVPAPGDVWEDVGDAVMEEEWQRLGLQEAYLGSGGKSRIRAQIARFPLDSGGSHAFYRVGTRHCRTKWATDITSGVQEDSNIIVNSDGTRTRLEWQWTLYQNLNDPNLPEGTPIEWAIRRIDGRLNAHLFTYEGQLFIFSWAASPYFSASPDNGGSPNQGLVTGEVHGVGHPAHDLCGIRRVRPLPTGVPDNSRRD